MYQMASPVTEQGQREQKAACPRAGKFLPTDMITNIGEARWKVSNFIAKNKTQATQTILLPKAHP